MNGIELIAVFCSLPIVQVDIWSSWHGHPKFSDGQ